MNDDDDFLDDLVDSIIAKGPSAPKKRRGMNGRSLGMLERAIPMIKAAAPITGRGVGYKLFVAKLIPNMSAMNRVYRLLKEAREQDMLPWGWIVDETREFECTPSWDRPVEFVKDATRQYRLDFWKYQPSRCEVWSEKGTIRGVLQPVLDKYGVGFRVMHGFASATVVNSIAADARPLTALYVGDWDPSGLYMSEVDLPERLAKYGGGHVEVKRIALTESQTARLPSFPARDKRKDPRYDWFIGDRCWEIDALDPNELRDCVEAAIKDCIRDPEAWERWELVNQAQSDSLRDTLRGWAAAQGRAM